jgi:hypothetical protein
MTEPGARLVALLERVLHRDTFETMVSPALADLQSELYEGWRQRAQHYAGLTIVIGFALLRDWRIDMLAAFDFGARRDVWRVAGLWYLAVTILLAGLVLKQQTPWHLLDVAVWPAIAVEAVLGARLYASYIAAGAAAFFLSRRLSAIKALVIAAGAVTVAFVALNIVATMTRSPMNRTIYESASRKLAASRVDAGDLPSWESQRWPRWVEAHGHAKSRSATVAEVAGSVAMAPFVAVLNFMPFALVGVAIARSRGGTVLVRLVGVIATTIVFARFGPGSFASGNDFMDFLRQMATLTTAALLWIGVGPLARLITAPFRTVGDWRPRPDRV